MDNLSELGKAVIKPLFSVVGDADPQKFADAFVTRPAEDKKLVCDLLLGNFEDAKAYYEKWNELLAHHGLERVEYIATTANDLHVVEEMKGFFGKGFVWDSSIEPKGPGPKGAFVEAEQSFEVDITIVLDRSKDPQKASQMRLYMPLGWCSGKLVQKAHDPFYLSPQDSETYLRGSEGQKGLENVVKFMNAMEAGDKQTLLAVTSDDFVKREPSSLYHPKAEWAITLGMFEAAGQGIKFEPWHAAIVTERSVCFEYNLTSFVGVKSYQPGVFVFDYADDGKLTMARVNDQTYFDMKEVMANVVKAKLAKQAKEVAGKEYQHHQ